MNPSSNPTPDSVTRRQFVKSSAAVAATFALPAFVRAQRSNPPSQRVNIACIGIGGKGRGDSAEAAHYGNVVAVCDIDPAGTAGGHRQALFPDVPFFTDYRKMFDKMGADIDAVTISVPDHSHYPAAMLAMMHGKHVFVQKPLTNSIWEARQMLLASRHHKVITQMGIQGHTFEGMRLLREWLEADAIGDVTQVRYWTNRPIWPQGPEVQFPPEPVPEGLDWDVWQAGVSPERPFSSKLHPKKWRAAWEYGSGALGDIGCHLFDAAFWSLDLGIPEVVQVEAVTDFTDEVAPEASVLRFRFTKNRAGAAIKPVEFLWSDGTLKPTVPLEMKPGTKLDSDFGQLIHGTKGTIYSPGGYCQTLRLIPEEAMQAFQRPPKRFPRVTGGPIKEWIDAIRGGPTPGANFEYAARLTEVVELGNLAIRLGRPIHWDSEKLAVIGVPAADKLIKRAYRPGWEMPVYPVS